MSLEFLRQKFARISNIQQLATNVINRTVTIRPVDFEGSTISSGLHKLKPRYSKITCKRLANELIKRGVDPIEVGLPIQYANDSSKHVKTPDFAKQHPPSYRQACREFKWEFVREQMAKMPQTIADWKSKRKEDRQKLLKNKLPF